jgi:transcriptional regulator with XRE-family HTH domain
MSDTDEKPGEVDRRCGWRLFAARERAGLSIEEVAERTGYTPEQIEAWETGTVVLYVDEMLKLCRTLGTNPMRILGWYAERKKLN